MSRRADSPAGARNRSRADISRIASEHGAANVRVFGSAGRGDAGAHDLDLLVKMGADRSLFDLIALSQELEDVLGIAVDVVSARRGSRPTYGIAFSPRQPRCDRRACLPAPHP